MKSAEVKDIYFKSFSSILHQDDAYQELKRFKEFSRVRSSKGSSVATSDYQSYAHEFPLRAARRLRVISIAIESKRIKNSNKVPRSLNILISDATACLALRSALQTKGIVFYW